jgi:hypothetical protein
MDDGVVYAKSSKGVAEVAERTGGLSLSARRVLIMIDGKRSVRELAPLLKPGEIDGVIALLEAQGYIQRRSEPDDTFLAARTNVAPDAAIRSPGPPTLDVPTGGHEIPEERNLVTIDEAKRRAVRELHDRLGPDADLMATRIERCRTAEELRDRLREAERLVAGFLNEAAAQDFVRALRRR